MPKNNKTDASNTEDDERTEAAIDSFTDPEERKNQGSSSSKRKGRPRNQSTENGLAESALNVSQRMAGISGMLPDAASISGRIADIVGLGNMIPTSMMRENGGIVRQYQMLQQMLPDHFSTLSGQSMRANLRMYESFADTHPNAGLLEQIRMMGASASLLGNTSFGTMIDKLLQIGPSSRSMSQTDQLRRLFDSVSLSQQRLPRSVVSIFETSTALGEAVKIYRAEDLIRPLVSVTETEKLYEGIIERTLGLSLDLREEAAEVVPLICERGELPEEQNDEDISENVKELSEALVSSILEEEYAGTASLAIQESSQAAPLIKEILRRLSLLDKGLTPNGLYITLVYAASSLPPPMSFLIGGLLGLMAVRDGIIWLGQEEER